MTYLAFKYLRRLSLAIYDAGPPPIQYKEAVQRLVEATYKFIW